MSEENQSPFDDDGGIDYHRWLQMNAFMREVHRAAWLERRNEMLLDLDMIDKVVDMMDDYPEAENIINKILRRLDNDKKY